MQAQVLIVQAPDQRDEGLSDVLGRYGWKLQALTSAEDCLDVLGEVAADCLIADIDDTEGAVLATALFNLKEDIPCVAITSDAASPLARQAHFNGWAVVPRSAQVLQDAVVEALLRWLYGPSRRLLSPIASERRLMPEVGNKAFRDLFRQEPASDLILTPGLRLAAMSSAYAHATMLDPDGPLGLQMFEVFPDNPDDPSASGVSNLNASLCRAASQGRPDQMALQRYDIRNRTTDRFEERWWYPINYPVIRKSKLQYIVHRVEDVTRFVRLRASTSVGDAAV